MIILEGYKIIKKIASGGMGDVYLAEHTVLETKVAIKSLHSNLVNDEDFRKRFKIEARVQAKLSHPNIVKLIDFQERKDGLYLVMEYVEGKQLDDYIREVTGPMPDEKLIPLFKEILSAIQHTLIVKDSFIEILSLLTFLLQQKEMQRLLILALLSQVMRTRV
jgi:serine/threonine-protein kinase